MKSQYVCQKWQQYFCIEVFFFRVNIRWDKILEVWQIKLLIWSRQMYLSDTTTWQKIASELIDLNTDCFSAFFQRTCMSIFSNQTCSTDLSVRCLVVWILRKGYYAGYLLGYASVLICLIILSLSTDVEMQIQIKMRIIFLTFILGSSSYRNCWWTWYKHTNV